MDVIERMIYVCVCNDGDCDNFDIRPDDVCQANEHRMRVEKFVPLAIHRGAVDDLLTFAQAVLDLPCPFSRDADPVAAQQRRASELITTYGGGSE